MISTGCVPILDGYIYDDDYPGNRDQTLCDEFSEFGNSTTVAAVFLTIRPCSRMCEWVFAQISASEKVYRLHLIALVMWNSYAFVHYGSMDEGRFSGEGTSVWWLCSYFVVARRALDQSNGAMFLNRKLIVQLSTSRFRPQPKDMSASSLSQPAKQLMGMGSSSSPYHHLTNGESLNGKQQQQQQATSLSSQYPFSDFNYELMTLNQHRQPSSPTSDSNPFLSSNTYRAPSPVASQYSSELLDQLTASSLKPNPIKSNKLMKTGMSI